MGELTFWEKILYWWQQIWCKHEGCYREVWEHAITIHCEDCGKIWTFKVKEAQDET